jgi:pyruvate/2-oxoglutarate dehydrogenase complex dihydrolipoamide dehydrogenase (E3) component
VGLSETEAIEQGVPHEVTRYGIDDLDRAIADGTAHGFVKVLTVPGKDKNLGRHHRRASTLATCWPSTCWP